MDCGNTEKFIGTARE